MLVFKNRWIIIPPHLLVSIQWYCFGAHRVGVSPSACKPLTVSELFTTVSSQLLLTLISTWCLSSASSISLSLFRTTAFVSSSCRLVMSQKVFTLSLSNWKKFLSSLSLSSSSLSLVICSSSYIEIHDLAASYSLGRQSVMHRLTTSQTTDY